MNSFHVIGLVTLLHVTAITCFAILLWQIGRRRPAFQYAVGVVGLLLTLSSPILVLILPEQHWFSSAGLPQGEHDIDISNTAVNAPRLKGSVAVSPLLHDSSLTMEMGSNESQARRPHDRRAFSPLVRNKMLMSVSMNSFFAVWLFGSTLVAYRLSKSHRVLRCLSRSWTTLPSHRLERVEQGVCAALNATKLPVIRISALAPIPLVMGVLRPVVVLPQHFADSATDESLRAVLIHECAHIMRRDPVVHMLQQVAGILFWIHPAISWLNQRISRSREELCDNFVIRNGNPADYSQLLLALSEICRQQRPPVPALSLFSARWTLEDRIRDLLDLRRKTVTQTPWAAKLGIVIVFGLVSLLLGGVNVVRTSTAAQPVTSQSEDLPTKSPGTTPAPGMREISIRGECLDGESTPISNVAIRVYRYQSILEPPVLAASAETDSDGRFQLSGVGTAIDRGLSDLVLTASATGYVSTVRFQFRPGDEDSPIELILASNPQSLSGIVTDVNGNPVPKVLVSHFPFYPPPGVWSAYTDEHGRYEIKDAHQWTPHSESTMKCVMRFRHPDFPLTQAYYKRIPQQVNVMLKPPAIVEGQVIDSITNNPVPNITVTAQGIARHGHFTSKTDSNGRYRLHMSKDHYNIRAEMDERVSITVKAIQAMPGKTVANADIKMVRGGIIAGTLFDVRTNRAVPILDGQTRYVGHYGPAFPRSGATPGTAKVNADGTFRLRVAPGLNYVYFMGGDMTGYFTVKEGEELKVNLVNEDPEPGQFSRFDPDQSLQSELIRAAQEEDADEAAAN